MGALTTAKTRMAPGGPGKQYALPIGDKGETVIVTSDQNVGFRQNVGRMIGGSKG